MRITLSHPINHGRNVFRTNHGLAIPYRSLALALGVCLLSLYFTDVCAFQSVFILFLRFSLAYTLVCKMCFFIFHVVV